MSAWTDVICYMRPWVVKQWQQGRCSFVAGQCKKKKKELQNTEMWHMWFIWYIMAVSGLLVEKEEQAVSDYFGERKKAPKWLLYSVLHLPLCPWLFHSVYLRLFPSDWICSARVPPPFTPISSSLSSLLSTHCLRQLFSTVFQWTACEHCSECGYTVWQALLVLSLLLLHFFLCVFEV